jgi:hypothetical protein
VGYSRGQFYVLFSWFRLWAIVQHK